MFIKKFQNPKLFKYFNRSFYNKFSTTPKLKCENCESNKRNSNENDNFLENFLENLQNLENVVPKNILTMSDVKQNVLNNLDIKPYAPDQNLRDYLLKYEPKLEDLPSRTMYDSFSKALLPLSLDLALQRTYASQRGGHIRNGRLLEDMDLFACWICHRHSKIPEKDSKIPLPYTFVTILVDEIIYHSTFRPSYNKDVYLYGHMSWVGCTSMEVTVWLEQADDNDVFQKFVSAFFLMACRNAINTKSAPINPLQLNTDYEKKIFKEAAQRKINRDEQRKLSTLNKEPNEEENCLIHNLFKMTVDKNSLTNHILPKNHGWIENTQTTVITPCFPQKLNAQNTIFGGYLMRIAVELSWVCAYKFAGHLPKLECICDVIFLKPIFVDEFLKFASLIVYTENQNILVYTICTKLILNKNNEKNTSIPKETTNVFEIIFKLPDNVLVQKVVPKTYREAMWYLEGRRRILQYLKDRDKSCQMLK